VPVQATQAPPATEVSQTGAFGSWQSAFDWQVTQVSALPHTGVLPVQALALAAVHCTQTGAWPLVSQTAVSPEHAGEQVAPASGVSAPTFSWQVLR
jgi:hypothetical protein